MLKLVTVRRLVLALVFLTAIAVVFLRALPDGRLHVWFLDVGQGDAILIQTPDDRQILVDGGPSPSALLDQLGVVLPFWDRSIDLLVLTHPDADHLSGLVPVFERYEVAGVLDSVGEDDPDGETWLAVVHAEGASRQLAAAGLQVIAGSVTLTVLNPPADSGKALDGNNRSVVLRLDYGESSVLLTGDAEAEAERAMLRGGLPLAASVLKVGHHGSVASTSAAFLTAVKPSLAVISVGADNRFGHPAPELLERLQGIEVLRTDEQGRIELVSEGVGWQVRTERKR